MTTENGHDNRSTTLSPTVFNYDLSSNGNLDSSCVTSQHCLSPDGSGNVHPFPELVTNRKNYSNKLIFAHLNVNGIRNKKSEVESVLENIDILGLTETKIDDSFPDCQFQVPHYDLHRIDRNSFGGGLMFYVNSKIPNRQRKDLCDSQTNGVECIVLEISLQKEKVFFLLLYKPPNVNDCHLVNVISNVIDRCIIISKSFYLIGDFNVDLSKIPNSLTSLFDAYDLKNVITKPTCFKNVNNPSLLDGVITNSPLRLLTHFNLCIGISDCHNLVGGITRMNAPKIIPRKIVYRSFKSFDDVEFNNDLSRTPFHVCEIFDDPSDQLWFHNKLLTEVIELHAPLKNKTVKIKQLPYMNSVLRKAINVKAMLKRKFHRFKTSATWNKYRCQRNYVNSLKRSSIIKYFEKKCSDKNSKDFWKTVSPFISNVKKSCVDISLLENDHIISCPKKVSNIFNEFFINVTKDLAEPDVVSEMSIPDVVNYYDNHKSIQLIKQNICNEHQFEFTSVTYEQVVLKLKSLKINKSQGYDLIPAKIIKIGASVLASSLTNLINQSIVNCVYPDDLKRAEVSPLFKKDDCYYKGNYRPVSLLSIISKVVEGLLCDQINIYYSKIISTNLSAYRKSYCCENVILKCVENWKCALDKNEVVGCILTDLSKAFDSIPHGLMLAKLANYGFCSNSVKFIKSYLYERPQRVKVGDIKSDWLYLERGVPQGSIVGPVLFNLFINDLLWLLKTKCDVYNYADDNTLAFCHKDPNIVKVTLEEASQISVEWFQDNFMKANPSKFQCMTLSRNNQNLKFNVGDSVITSTDCVKLLGINIDNKLNFSQHVKHLIKKCGKQVSVLGRLSNVLTTESKLQIVDALICSNLRYCNSVYHYCGKSESMQLEKLFKRALRYVFNDFSSEYKDLLLKANRKSLYLSRLHDILFDVHKLRLFGLPPLTKDFLQQKVTNYELRNVLVQPKFNTIMFGFKSFKYSGPMFYNKLPNVFKELSLQDFKGAIQSWEPVCKCGICLSCVL